MSFRTVIDRLVPDLAATVVRFPVPAASAAALCLYWNWTTAVTGSRDVESVIAAAAAAFAASGAAHLFAEGRRFARAPSVALAAAAAFSMGGLAGAADWLSTSWLFLFGGLILVLMIAGFLRAGAAQAALWLFNLRLGLAALLATLVGLLFAAGLSAIVEALNFLFGAGLPSRLHEHFWGTSISLVAPLYGLSLVPGNLNEEVRIDAHRGALLERGVSVLVNFVLVPIVIVYAAILHAYAVKMLVEASLPKGQVASMVSIFAIGGTAAWLVAWPWREGGTRLLRAFMRGWFWLLIVPAGLVAVAIWRRISDYGVTPDRYGIVLVAVWIAALAAYLAWRRREADMRAMLGGFAALLLVGAAGPFGAHGLTVASQFARLEALLVRTGHLKEGLIVMPPPALSQEDAASGYSMLAAISEAGGAERLKPWFAAAEKSPFTPGNRGWSLVNDISSTLGFVSHATPVDAVMLNVTAVGTLEIPGNAVMLGPLQVYRGMTADLDSTDPSAVFDGENLTIRTGGTRLSYPVAELLARVKAAAAAPGQPQPPVPLRMEDGTVLLFDQFYGTLGAEPQLGSARLWVIRQR